MPQPLPKDEQGVGRLRAAWLVLRGQCVVPQQIVAEWLEYQTIFDDLLSRWSSRLARDAKQQRDRIAKEMQDTHITELPRAGRKAALRSQVAAARGISGKLKSVDEVSDVGSDKGSKTA